MILPNTSRNRMFFEKGMLKSLLLIGLFARPAPSACWLYRLLLWGLSFGNESAPIVSGNARCYQDSLSRSGKSGLNIWLFLLVFLHLDHLLPLTLSHIPHLPDGHDPHFSIWWSTSSSYSGCWSISITLSSLLFASNKLLSSLDPFSAFTMWWLFSSMRSSLW